MVNISKMIENSIIENIAKAIEDSTIDEVVKKPGKDNDSN
jgi:hypothetical protein